MQQLPDVSNEMCGNEDTGKGEEKQRGDGRKGMKDKTLTGFCFNYQHRKGREARDFCPSLHCFGSNTAFTYQIKLLLNCEAKLESTANE